MGTLTCACPQLGPGICITRVPVCGRAFEYVSGGLSGERGRAPALACHGRGAEDPMLGYYLAKAAVEGLQSTGVIANAKHYMANNQVSRAETGVGVCA